MLQFLQAHPLIPLFLTLGLGFWLGKIRFGSFSLGSVAATLIAGVVIGQADIEIPDMVKTVFFLFFLFSVGYGVGPQFFRAFKGERSEDSGILGRGGTGECRGCSIGRRDFRLQQGGGLRTFRRFTERVSLSGTYD